MKNYDEYFEGNNVPDRLKGTAIAIMKRFTIIGICDGMYICNIIAHTCGIGDGKGIFKCDNNTEIAKIAKALQSAYGCNIYKEDLKELEKILITGKLDREKSVCGIKKYILNCEEEKRTCDEWRVDYLNRCINEAKENLHLIES